VLAACGGVALFNLGFEWLRRKGIRDNRRGNS